VAVLAECLAGGEDGWDCQLHYPSSSFSSCQVPSGTGDGDAEENFHHSLSLLLQNDHLKNKNKGIAFEFSL
jgi:hypothetical protein